MKSITQLIEESWGMDDTYLSPEDRYDLMEQGLLTKWADAYFEDLGIRYQGTCTSLSCKDSEFLEEFDLFQELDNVLFECTGCGWWYESGDDGPCPAGEHWCTDCSEENGYEEE